MTPALILLELLAFAEATLEREPGSRFAKGGGSSDITLSRRLGNKALNALLSIFILLTYTLAEYSVRIMTIPGRLRA